MHPDLRSSLQEELSRLEADHRLRACPLHEGSSRANPRVDGRPAISFSSNDYLGLACHPALAQAAAAAASRSGFGAGAARLVSGEFPEHRELESSLALFLGYPSALLFPTGYQANIGVLCALAGPDDLILSDAANHASLIDGCRLSKATIAIYPHLDSAGAAALLETSSERRFRRTLIVTESVFSMDGDVAPLPDLREIASRRGAALVIDEAHALGALGPGGRGICRQLNIEPDVLIGTLGKSFGTFGGFVVGVPELRAILINRARTFLFTTAAPPPLVAASSAALTIINSSEGDLRRKRLLSNVAALTTAIPALQNRADAIGVATPIVPIILGREEIALSASSHLRSRGFFVQAIRPPTVAPGTSRLRITLSAEHTPEQITSLAAALAEIYPTH